MIRSTDILLSIIGLLVFSPVFLLIIILIVLDSEGPIFYRQIRVGMFEKDFLLLKFRSMYVQSERNGLLTIGDRDSRITRIGFLLRKFKLDELPQLINVLLGNMSFVGPRPEVRKYVNLYTDEQKAVLKVKPGITDFASIYFRRESEILHDKLDPEEYYIKSLLPKKVKLNMIFIERRNILQYFLIIIITVLSLLPFFNKILDKIMVSLINERQKNCNEK